PKVGANCWWKSTRRLAAARTSSLVMEDPSRLNQGLTTSWPAPRCCAHRLPEPPNLRKHVLLRLSDFFFRCRTRKKIVSHPISVRRQNLAIPDLFLKKRPKTMPICVFTALQIFTPFGNRIFKIFDAFKDGFPFAVHGQLIPTPLT